MVIKESMVDSRHGEKRKITRRYRAGRKRRGCRNEQILKGLRNHVKMCTFHPNGNERS